MARHGHSPHGTAGDPGSMPGLLAGVTETPSPAAPRQRALPAASAPEIPAAPAMPGRELARVGAPIAHTGSHGQRDPLSRGAHEPGGGAPGLSNISAYSGGGSGAAGGGGDDGDGFRGWDFDDDFDEEPTGGGGGGQPPKKKRRALKWLLGSSLALSLTVLVIVLVIIAAIMQLVLGNAFIGPMLKAECTAEGVLKTVGLKDKKSAWCKLQDALPEDELNALKDELDEPLRQMLDCANATPEARAKGYCIDGLMKTAEDAEENASPVPPRAEWLMPIWQKASEKYKVPWELLAAVNGARTSFGLYNCPPDSTNNIGGGFYRFPLDGGWEKHRVDAGTAKTVKSGRCRKSQAPAKFSKPKGGAGDWYDAVDSTFGEAKMLAARGARKDKWNYAGSAANSCTPTPKKDGRTFYVPEVEAASGGGNGKLGYNEKLQIPDEIVQLAADHRYPTGGRATGRQMPIPAVRKILTAAWEAFGVTGGKLESYVNANMKQIERESGFKPNILQGFIGDVNDNNPAGGLFQFIPETFDSWNVDGFDDRFNPLDNILAAVNAQSNAASITTNCGVRILNGCSGWGPSGGTNPYNTGGKARNTTTAGAGTKKTSSGKPKPYKGKKQTDETSKAVAYQGSGRTASPCYVAMVHDWYEAIKANPPVGGGVAGAGPKGTKKITGGGKFVPLPGFPGERIDVRLIPDIKWMVAKYDIFVTDGYAEGGHAADGEHPLGLAIDFGPGRKSGMWAGSWGKIDALIKWSDPKGWNVPGGASIPNAPFRWVGYDGDGGTHGKPSAGGNHAHISWQHAPTPPMTPAPWVLVLDLGDDRKSKGDSCKAERSCR